MSTDLTAATPSSSAPGLDHDSPVSAPPLGRITVGTTPAVPFNPNARRKRKDGISLVAPSETKTYKIALACIALRAQGFSWKGIGEELQMNPDTARAFLKTATQRGWTNLRGLVQDQDKLDFVIANKVLENIHQGLGERTEEGALTAGAREITLETAKGVGLFKSHQVVKGDQPTNVGVALSVHVQLPPQAAEQSAIKIRPGTLGGVSSVDVPADAELIDMDAI